MIDWNDKKVVRILIIIASVVGFIFISFICLLIFLPEPEIKPEEKAKMSHQMKDQFIPTICPKAGLGDAIQSIDNEWGKKYRNQDKSGITFVGESEEQGFAYDTADIHNYGNPQRAGRLSGIAKNMWGVLKDEYPLKYDFYNGIKDLMPKDFRLVKTYKKDNKYLFELNSVLLSRTQGIDSAFVYNSKFNESVKLGDFTLIVFEDSNNSSEINSWTLLIGKSNETFSMKSIDYNPW